MGDIDEQTKRIRSIAVRNALASSRLEGGRPSEQTLANLKRYTEGKATIDALVAEVVSGAKRRHVRT